MRGLLRTEHTFLRGNAADVLLSLPERSVHCCVTSPPYWNLRSYLPEDSPDKSLELGSEPTPAIYLQRLVDVFGQVARVLRDDGTLWLNIGDSYARTGVAGFKEKDLMGMPWLLAARLRDAGWYLRQDIIWQKPSAMPESVIDRPQRSHEYLFLLAKSPRYFYDVDAVREPHDDKAGPPTRFGRTGQANVADKVDPTGNARSRMVSAVPPSEGYNPLGRNCRSVWAINPQPFKEAHFATFPPELPSRCIKAGTGAEGCCPACGAPWRRVVEHTPLERNAAVGVSRKALHTDRYSRHKTAANGGQSLVGYARSTAGWEPTCECNAGEPVPCTVLDPFAGAGTTALAAKRLGRSSVSIELSKEYLALAQARLDGDGELVTPGPLADWFANATPKDTP